MIGGDGAYLKVVRASEEQPDLESTTPTAVGTRYPAAAGGCRARGSRARPAQGRMVKERSDILIRCVRGDALNHRWRRWDGWRRCSRHLPGEDWPRLGRRDVAPDPGLMLPGCVSGTGLGYIPVRASHVAAAGGGTAVYSVELCWDAALCVSGERCRGEARCACGVTCSHFISAQCNVPPVGCPADTGWSSPGTSENSV